MLAFEVCLSESHRKPPLYHSEQGEGAQAKEGQAS